MIDARSKIPAGLLARDFPLLHRALAPEVNAPAAPPEPTEAMTKRRLPLRPSARLRGISADILAAVNARLPGRIQDLAIRIDDDQFVMSGTASSYHVKQVAQHVAMNALDAVMLGRLVNEIEVRAPR